MWLSHTWKQSTSDHLVGKKRSGGGSSNVVYDMPQSTEPPPNSRADEDSRNERKMECKEKKPVQPREASNYPQNTHFLSRTKKRKEMGGRNQTWKVNKSGKKTLMSKQFELHLEGANIYFPQQTYGDKLGHPVPICPPHWTSELFRMLFVTLSGQIVQFWTYSSRFWSESSRHSTLYSYSLILVFICVLHQFVMYQSEGQPFDDTNTPAACSEPQKILECGRKRKFLNICTSSTTTDEEKRATSDGFIIAAPDSREIRSLSKKGVCVSSFYLVGVRVHT